MLVVLISGFGSTKKYLEKLNFKNQKCEKKITNVMFNFYYLDSFRKNPPPLGYAARPMSFDATYHSRGMRNNPIIQPQLMPNGFKSCV